MALLDWLRCLFCGTEPYGITQDGREVGDSNAIGVWAECHHSPVWVGLAEINKLALGAVCPRCGSQEVDVCHRVRREPNGRVTDAVTISCDDDHSDKLVLASKDADPLEMEWGTDRQYRLTNEW